MWWICVYVFQLIYSLTYINWLLAADADCYSPPDLVIWGNPNFCANRHVNFCSLCCVIEIHMSAITVLLLIYFVLFFLGLCQLWRFLSSGWFSGGFIFQMLLLLWILHLVILGSGLYFSFCGTCSGTVCNIYIHFQELQVAALILDTMLFIYHVRLFPYIMLIVLLKLIYTSNVVQYAFCLQTSVPHTESGWQAWSNSPYSILTHLIIEADYLSRGAWLQNVTSVT